MKNTNRPDKNSLIFFLIILFTFLLIDQNSFANQLAGYSTVNLNSTSGIFPKLEKSGWSGIAFVNITAETANITLTAYDDSGTVIATEKLTLGGFAKVVNYAPNLFTANIDSATYFSYVSSSELVGFQLNGTNDEMMLDGLPALMNSGATLYYPHIASDGTWETEICIVNSGSEVLTGTLTAFNDSGTEVSTAKKISLQPNARTQITVGGINGFASPETIGHIVFSATSGQGVGYTKFYIDGKYRVAIPSIGQVTNETLNIAHIVSGYGWWTGVSLVNTGSSSVNLTIEFDNGASKIVTLPANGHSAFTVASLFSGVSQTDINSAVIKNAAGVIGLELFALEENNLLSGILLTDNTASQLYYPHVASDQKWWTGIVAYNPSAVVTNLTIRPYKSDGTILTTQNRSVTEKSKYIGLTSQLNFPSGTAWFSVEASSPITGFELFGTNEISNIVSTAMSLENNVKNVYLAGGQEKKLKATVNLASKDYDLLLQSKSFSINVADTLEYVTISGAPTADQANGAVSSAEAALTQEAQSSSTALLSVYISYPDDPNVCASSTRYGPFNVTWDPGSKPTSETSSVTPSGPAIDIINAGFFEMCVVILPPVDSYLSVSNIAVDIEQCDLTPMADSAVLGTFEGTYSCDNFGTGDDPLQSISLVVSKNSDGSYQYTDDGNASYKGYLCGNVLKYNGGESGDYTESGTLTFNSDGTANKTSSWNSIPPGFTGGTCSDDLVKQ